MHIIQVLVLLLLLVLTQENFVIQFYGEWWKSTTIQLQLKVFFYKYWVCCIYINVWLRQHLRIRKQTKNARSTSDRVFCKRKSTWIFRYFFKFSLLLFLLHWQQNYLVFSSWERKICLYIWYEMLIMHVQHYNLRLQLLVLKL